MINFNATSYHLLGASEVPGRMLLWVLCLWLKFNPRHRLRSDAPWAFCVEQETGSQQVIYRLLEFRHKLDTPRPPLPF